MSSEKRVRPLTATLLAVTLGLDALILFFREFSTDRAELGYLFLFLVLYFITVMGLLKGYLIAWVLTLVYSGTVVLFSILGLNQDQTLVTIIPALILVLGLANPSRRYYNGKGGVAEDEDITKEPLTKGKVLLRIVLGGSLLFVVGNTFLFLALIYAVLHR